MLHYPVDLDSRPRLVWAGGGRRQWTGTRHFAMGQVWCFHAYRYSARLIVNGNTFKTRPGSCSFTPPYAQLTFVYGTQVCSHESLQFILPSRPEAAWALPVMINDGAALTARLLPCIEWYKSDRRRAEVRLWDELASVAVRNANPTVVSPLVQAARDRMEEQLADGINVADVARALGISPEHLTRCFQRELGCTCSVWLKNRRRSLALHLLVNGDAPIKAVAAAVGMPDLQHFNKFIRAEFGHAPRSIRQQKNVNRLKP